MHRRILTVCILLVLITVGTTGCVTGTPETDEPSTRVELDASGTIEGNELKVDGTATAPNGALVSVVAVYAGNAYGGPDARVTDEAFSWEGLLSPGPPGSVVITVRFDTYGQPAEVIELYGEYGEHMEGDVTVVEHEGKEYKRVEMEFTVTR